MFIYLNRFLFLNRYLLQFCVNLFGKYLHCSLIHFAPHLLKTLELCNYTFNVFISIVSGKNGRCELINMLLCRSNTSSSNLNTSLTHFSSTTPKLRNQQRINNKIDYEMCPVQNRPLLSNNANHY